MISWRSRWRSACTSSSSLSHPPATECKHFKLAYSKLITFIENHGYCALAKRKFTKFFKLRGEEKKYRFSGVFSVFGVRNNFQGQRFQPTCMSTEPHKCCKASTLAMTSTMRATKQLSSERDLSKLTCASRRFVVN